MNHCFDSSCFGSTKSVCVCESEMRPLDLLRVLSLYSTLKSILYLVPLFPNWGKCTSRSFGALQRGTGGDSKFGIKLLTMNLINFESLLLIIASIKCEHLLLEYVSHLCPKNIFSMIRNLPQHLF